MSGGGGGGGSQILGYRYYFGLHMGICRGPIDELIQINVGDRPAWYGNVTGTSQFYLNNPGMFGNDAGEGGIQGPVDVMMGEPDQLPSDGLVAMLPAPVAGFRGMFTIFFNGLVSAMNPYPKSWKFRGRRILKGWDGPVFQPALALISMIRPVSAGESQTPDGMPTTELAYPYVTFEPHVVSLHIITIVPALDPTAIVQTMEIQYLSDTTNDYYLLNAGETPDFTISGNVVTLIDGSPLAVRFGLEQWDGITLLLNYSYAYTVVSGQQTSNSISGGEGLIKAMNPAHIIFECFTNRIWGRGLDRAELDQESFRVAAQTLYAEGFGMCLKWSRSDSLDSFVQGILDHIGASVFVSKSTMLMTLRLIRGDYDVNSLPLFDSESGLLKITSAAVAGVGPIINEVQVTYHDPITDMDGKVRAQNVALRQAANGIVNSLTKTYAGLPTAALAGRVAQRDLRASAPGLRKFNLVFDRRGYKIEPGSVIRIRDLPRSLKETVVRVGHVQDGTLASGNITVVGIQDVFGFPKSTYLGHEPPTWVPPNRRPCLGERKVFEMPYLLLFKSNTTANFNTIEPTSAFVGAMMEQGQPLNNGVRVAVKEGAIETSENPTDQTWLCSI